MAETEASEPEPTVEQWIFGGVRVLNDKRVHAWIDKEITPETGRERLYTAKGKFVIGGVYEVKISRDGGKMAMIGEPKYTGETANYEDRRLLWAKESAALTRLSALSRERNDAKQNALDEAMEPLIEVARKLRTGAEKDALVAYIIRRIYSPW